MDLPDAHAEALDHTGRLVETVPASGWGDPTPDEEWDVRALVGHITSGNRWVPPLVAGRTIEEVGNRFDGDVLGDDPVASYRSSAEEAGAAFRVQGAMERDVAVSYGPVPGRVYCGHRFLDVLIHGWDLAVALGVDRTLPAHLVEALWIEVEPQAEGLAAGGAFGSPQPVPDDAELQTRLLAVLGRDAGRPRPTR
jgi:uncharacterized protein (TIGR03086 family)